MVTEQQSKQEEGVVYLSSTGSYYVSSKLDTENIKKYSRNVYGAGIAHKQKLLIFQEKYTIEAFKPDGEQDPDLARRLTQMFDQGTVNLWSAMQTAWKDIFWYGMSIKNPVWGYQGNEYIIQKLRHLPAESFGDAPYERPIVYSDVLKGIVYNPATGEIEAYQTVSPMDISGPSAKMLQKRLMNVILIKDDSIADLAGYPTAAPIIPLLVMLDFSWQAQVQKINRVGSPIIFLKITNPTGDDITYGQNFLKNWGRSTALQLRPNFELIVPDLKDNSTALETIDALSQLIIDYFSPVSLLKSQSANPISGSSNSELNIINTYIMGVHAWLSSAFQPLLDEYLKRNAYEGYTAKIVIPSPSIDKSEIWLKQATEGARNGSLTTNEIRNLLELPELDESGLTALRADVESRQGGISAVGEAPVMQKAKLAIAAMKTDPLDPYNIVSPKQGRKLIQTVLGGIESGDE